MLKSLLNELNSSIQQNKKTINLVRHMTVELDNFEKTIKTLPNNEEKTALYGVSVIDSLKRLNRINLDRLENEQRNNFVILHKIYDIQESHYLKPYSKIRN